MTEVDPKLRDVLFAMLDEMEHQRAKWEASVTKRKFNELSGVVRTLAEAQARTELRIEELAEVQKKTEQPLDAPTQRGGELAQTMRERFQRINQ